MPNKIQFRFDAGQPTIPQPVPPHVLLVWVQCKDHRCLAYKSSNGKWINFYTGKILTGFVEIIG